MQKSVRRYAYINAKLRARISNIIKEDVFRQMFGAHSLEEAIGYLRETPYSSVEEVYKKTKDLKLGELELFREEVLLYTGLDQYVQGEVRDFLRALVMRYEIETLKNTLRLFFKRAVKGEPLDNEEQYLYRERILYSLPIDGILNARTFHGIPDLLRRTPYAPIFEDYLPAVEREKSLFTLEAALDRFFYQELITKAEHLKGRDREISLLLLGIEIDMYNLRCIIRLKISHNMPMEKIRSVIIPRGFHFTPDMMEQAYDSKDMRSIILGVIKEGGPITLLAEKQTVDIQSHLALVEQLLEQTLLNQAHRILSGYPFTIGILLVYFMLKKREINRIQSILNAKLYNLSASSFMGDFL